MSFVKTDLEAPMVGSVVITGYRVLGNYRNEYIIAQSANEKSPEPFVVWNLDSEGDPYSGIGKPAQTEFVSRCFPWFWEQPEPAQELVQGPGAEEDFTAGSTSLNAPVDVIGTYPTHHVSVYKGWLLVEICEEKDAGVLCYAPNEDWGSDEIKRNLGDLSFIQDCYEVEWTGASLRQASLPTTSFTARSMPN